LTLKVLMYRKPLTFLPTSAALGLIVTLMTPCCPGPSTSGLYVAVPSTRSVPMLPASDVTPASNGCIRANASAETGIPEGAPLGPYGPTKDGTESHGPHGTSGATMVAATVLFPTGRANKSGEPVTPTGGVPASSKASMVIGTEDCATNCKALTS